MCGTQTDKADAVLSQEFTRSHAVHPSSCGAVLNFEILNPTVDPKP